MPQDDGQSQIRRRSITGDQGSTRLPRYPKAERTMRTTEGPFGDEILDLPRTNTSVVRYDGGAGVQTQRTGGALSTTGGIPQRRQTGSRTTPRQTRTTSTTAQQRPPSKPHKKVHWLLPLGVGMVAMLVLWMLGSTAVSWGIQRYNDLRYGNPRTFQVDQVVGHNDSSAKPSHFIAVNLNRQAVVVELMGGDPAKAVTYVAPVYIAGPGGDLAPVTLSFKDMTGDGKLDMIIHIQLPSQDQISVFVNDGGKFRPSNGNDKIRTE